MGLLRFAFYAHFHTTSGVVCTAGKTTFHHSPNRQLSRWGRDLDNMVNVEINLEQFGLIGGLGVSGMLDLLLFKMSRDHSLIRDNQPRVKRN